MLSMSTVDLSRSVLVLTRGLRDTSSSKRLKRRANSALLASEGGERDMAVGSGATVMGWHLCGRGQW